MSAPTPEEWHAQFLRQARWTQGICNQLFRQEMLFGKIPLEEHAVAGVMDHPFARRVARPVCRASQPREEIEGNVNVGAFRFKRPFR